MTIDFVAAVDAELQALELEIVRREAEQKALTPHIFMLRTQRQTLTAYRRTLALQDAGEEGTP